jgi:hypothetical protein
MLTLDGKEILLWDVGYNEVLLDDYTVISPFGEMHLPQQFRGSWILGWKIRNKEIYK